MMLSRDPTGTALAELERSVTQEAVMGTVADFEALENKGPSDGYASGVTDGQSARAEGGALTLYLQVGIDDYARGFRAGFFGQLDLRTTEQR
jgi:hypothetical protein